MFDKTNRISVIDRLKTAGWIVSAKFNDILSQDAAPGASPQLSCSIEWTDHGKQQCKILYSLFEELDYNSGPRWGGEFEVLYALCRISSHEPQDHNKASPPQTQGR